MHDEERHRMAGIDVLKFRGQLGGIQPNVRSGTTIPILEHPLGFSNGPSRIVDWALRPATQTQLTKNKVHEFVRHKYVTKAVREKPRFTNADRSDSVVKWEEPLHTVEIASRET